MTQQEKLEFEKILGDYINATLESKKQKEIADSLKDRVVKGLKSLGVTNYTLDDCHIKMVDKTSTKYDEYNTVAFLKNEFNGRYVIETLDTKALTEAIKKDASLADALKESITQTTSSSLTVTKD